MEKQYPNPDSRSVEARGWKMKIKPLEKRFHSG